MTNRIERSGLTLNTQYGRSKVGFPIRKSLDQSSFAAPQGLSQRTTSFIASQRQGIHRMLLRHLIALVIDVRSDRQPLQSGSGQATRSQKDQSNCGFQQLDSCLPNITVQDQLSLPQTATFPLHDVDWNCARPDCSLDQRKLVYPDLLGT